MMRAPSLSNTNIYIRKSFCFTRKWKAGKSYQSVAITVLNLYIKFSSDETEDHTGNAVDRRTDFTIVPVCEGLSIRTLATSMLFPEHLCAKKETRWKLITQCHTKDIRASFFCDLYNLLNLCDNKTNALLTANPHCTLQTTPVCICLLLT